MAVVRVRGLKELKQALAQMSKDAPKELAKANKQAGSIVVAEARRRAPRGPHEGGGHVVSISKSIRAVQSPNKVTVQAGGSSSPQAAGAEFGGTIPRRGWKGRKAQARRLANFYGGKSVTHLKKQPYLLPAIEAKLADVVIAYERMIDGLVAKFRGTT